MHGQTVAASTSENHRQRRRTDGRTRTGCRITSSAAYLLLWMLVAGGANAQFTSTIVGESQRVALTDKGFADIICV